jgi:rod shape-determining protein MreC
MFEWFMGHRRGAVLAASILISLLIIAQPTDAGLSQARWIGLRAAAFGQWIFRWPLRLAERQGENRFLRHRVLELSRRRVDRKELYLENSRLRRLLDFSREEHWSYLPAKVLAYGPDSPPITAMLDVGTASGVERHQAVVSPEGLVGLIDHDPDGQISLVRLLTHPATRVSVVVENDDRPSGIVEWRDDRLTLGHVPAESGLAPGDSVVSSGLGGVFPPSLFIGVISSAVEDPDAMFQTVELDAAVATTLFEELFVVQYRQSEPVSVKP